jgi:short-subunit dehydrogenase
MKGLQGKVAVVTGGSSGIGQAIAIRLGEEGVDVAINNAGIQIAEDTDKLAVADFDQVFGINGPISASPLNYIWLREFRSGKRASPAGASEQLTRGRSRVCAVMRS